MVVAVCDQDHMGEHVSSAGCPEWTPNHCSVVDQTLKTSQTFFCFFEVWENLSQRYRIRGREDANHVSGWNTQPSPQSQWIVQLYSLASKKSIGMHSFHTHKKMHLIKTRHAEREKSAYFLTSPRVELLVLLCYKICQTQPPQLRQRKAVWVGGFRQCWTIWQAHIFNYSSLPLLPLRHTVIILTTTRLCLY